MKLLVNKILFTPPFKVGFILPHQFGFSPKYLLGDAEKI